MCARLWCRLVGSVFGEESAPIVHQPVEVIFPSLFEHAPSRAESAVSSRVSNAISFSGVAALIRALSARPLSAVIELNANSLTDGAGSNLVLRPLHEVTSLLLHPSNVPPSSSSNKSGTVSASASHA